MRSDECLWLTRNSKVNEGLVHSWILHERNIDRHGIVLWTFQRLALFTTPTISILFGQGLELISIF